MVHQDLVMQRLGWDELEAEVQQGMLWPHLPQASPQHEIEGRCNVWEAALLCL